MARVDRLFGVTMAERGVSQLVSVDLGAPPPGCAEPADRAPTRLALTHWQSSYLAAAGVRVAILTAVGGTLWSARASLGDAGWSRQSDGRPPRMSEEPPPDRLARLGEQIDGARRERLRAGVERERRPAAGGARRRAADGDRAGRGALRRTGAWAGFSTVVFGTRPWGLIVLLLSGNCGRHGQCLPRGEGRGLLGAPAPPRDGEGRGEIRQTADELAAGGRTLADRRIQPPRAIHDRAADLRSISAGSTSPTPIRRC